MSAYTDLITSEHADKAKFVAAVKAATDPFVDLQAVLRGMPDDFDLDQAIGAQLDDVGQWVGISRNIKTPLTGVYFAWDTAGVGWDEGYWKRPFDPSQGLTSLLDGPYRLLLKATIALNVWDGELASAKAAIDPLFPNNALYIQDNQDMSMTVAVSGPKLDVISAGLLTGGYLAMKPAGVRINFVFTSDPPAPIFGWDVDNAYIGGWDTGAWSQDTPPL
jgi:hypothetical protein